MTWFLDAVAAITTRSDATTDDQRPEQE